MNKNLTDVKVFLDASYYMGNTILDDSEYDVLDEQMNFHLPVAKREKHLISMGSMPKIRSEEELQRFKKVNRDLYVTLELKLDGAGVELIYEYKHGIVGCYFLTHAISRGASNNPMYGQDVLPHIKFLKNKVPKTIHVPDTRYGNKLSVRCEYILSNENFDFLKEKQEWSVNRSASWGLLSNRVCSYINTFPDLYYYNIKNELGETIELKHSTFPLQKIPMLNKYNLKELTEEQLLTYLNEAKESFSHPVDGIVINTGEDTIGLNGKVAYKPKQSNVKFTTLQNVIWQISRLGRLNPVGEVEPVLLNGSFISRVTLNNINYIKQLNLEIGSVIEIQQAGEIIPEILKVISAPTVKTIPIQPPTTCPYCNHTVKKENSFFYCTNSKCKEKIIKSIEYVFKDVFNLKGFGYAYCKTLVEHFNIQDTLDLFRIDLEELLTFGFINSTNKNLTEDLFKFYKNLAIKKIPLKACYMLLNLAHISSTSADILSKHIKNIHDYLSLLEAIYEAKDLGKYSIIPMNVLESLVLNRNRIMTMFNLLSGYIRLPKIGVLTDKVFCITGSASKPRNDIIELIELNGGVYINNVSKKTTALLVGSQPGQTKLSKAIKYNIPIVDITDDLILNLIKGNFIF